MPRCPRCDDVRITKDGRTASGQRYRCRACRRTFTDRTGSPFAGFRWPREIIALAVHGHCGFRLAANVVTLLTERQVCGSGQSPTAHDPGIDVSARTILTWVQTCGPLVAEAARRRARRVGTRRWVDATDIRVKGRWAYLYQVIDKDGQVIDVLLHARRDLNWSCLSYSALRQVSSFSRAIDSGSHPLPPPAHHCLWNSALLRYLSRA